MEEEGGAPRGGSRGLMTECCVHFETESVAVLIILPDGRHVIRFVNYSEGPASELAGIGFVWLLFHFLFEKSNLKCILKLSWMD